MMTDESALCKNLAKKGFKHEIVVHRNKEWILANCQAHSRTLGP